MKTISPKKTLWLAVTAVLTVAIVLVSIFSLKNGYHDIFPYFYILPLLLLAYFFPRYSVYVTILLGWVFLGLVFLYGPADIRLYTSSFAFFYVFVSIGVVVSAFSGQLVQERRYREIFENSQAGIFAIDLKHRQIREVNTRAAVILGYVREELAARPSSILWPDSDQETLFLQKIRLDRHITDMEIALRKKDQTLIWVLVTAALTTEDWIVCSIVDITERKRIKDELIESELRYRTLFEGASDAIFLHNLDGRIAETNAIAGRYLGYSKQEFLQMRLHDIDLHPATLFTPEMVQVLLSRGHILFDTVLKKKNGTQIPVEISSRISEYAGTPMVMSTVRDISERKKA
jgi:PAS domain S-box-containing protein